MTAVFPYLSCSSIQPAAINITKNHIPEKGMCLITTSPDTAEVTSSCAKALNEKAKTIENADSLSTFLPSWKQRIN